jgi:hypothetical protein
MVSPVGWTRPPTWVRSINPVRHAGSAASTHLEQRDIERILGATERVIALATTSAKVVVTATQDEITVSVVREVSAEDAGRRIESADAEPIWSNRTAWMTIHHRLSGSGDPPTDLRVPEVRNTGAHISRSALRAQSWPRVRIGSPVRVCFLWHSI